MRQVSLWNPLRNLASLAPFALKILLPSNGTLLPARTGTCGPEGEDFQFPAAEIGVTVLVQTVGEVDEGAGSEAPRCSGFSPVGAAAPGHAAELRAAVRVLNRNPQVTILDNFERRGEAETGGEEQRFPVADAEGAKAFEPGEEIGRQIGETEFGVALHVRDDEVSGEKVFCLLRHAGAEFFDARRRQREADRVGVASEAGKEFFGVRGVGGGEGVEQVETGD